MYTCGWHAQLNHGTGQAEFRIMRNGSQDSHDPFNTKRPEVHELKGWRWFVFYPVVWFLRLYFKTWRFHLSPESRQAIEDAPSPRMIVVWHNRSLAAPEMFSQFLDPSRIACLISPSRLAAWEVAFFRVFQLSAIRGSTTRRSIQAGIELLRKLRAGMDVGISPDGPSGPLYTFQKGAVAIARRAKVPVLIMLPNTRVAYRMRTWDRHMLPLPFAKIEVCVRAVQPDDPLWNKPDVEAAEELRRVCLEMTDDPFKLNSHE